MAKSWQQKFDTKRKPEIVTFHKAYAGIPAGEKFLISTPQAIDQYLAAIPAGKSVDFQTMKKDLALDQGVQYICPLTTGIFTRIVAELAFEKFSQGATIQSVTPFWRLIHPGMPLAKKLSFGPTFIENQRRAEGIKD